MIKLLYSLIAIFMSAALLAQQSPVNTDKVDKAEKRTHFGFNKINKAAPNQSTNWFNYMDEIATQKPSVPYYRNWLFPDSTVWVEYSNGMGKVGRHSMGQVVDPTSSVFSITGAISPDANYSLDSVAIPYRYHRPIDGNPDTLIIQIFIHNQITYRPLSSSWTQPQDYAYAPYDYIQRKGQNPEKEIVVLLDNNDTITGPQGLIKEFVGIDFLPGEKFAMTFTFFPGNPYNENDTIDYLMSPPPASQINSFRNYYIVDEIPSIISLGHYNHALTANTSVRYNISTNGWNGKYISGNAWGDGNHQADAYFLLTYEDFTGIKTERSADFAKFSPNPASDYVRMDYQINNAGIAEIELVNLLGIVVFRSILDIMGNSQFIDVSKLSEGVYFTRFSIDGDVKTTSRIVVSR